MIAEWFVGLFAGIQTWFVGLFGTAAVPEWLSTVASFLGDVTARASGLGAWLPWALMGTVGGGLLTLWGALWLVKGVRWVWGLTPFSGGS